MLKAFRQAAFGFQSDCLNGTTQLKRRHINKLGDCELCLDQDSADERKIDRKARDFSEIVAPNSTTGHSSTRPFKLLYIPGFLCICDIFLR